MENAIGLNSSSLIEMWLNNNLIYTNCLWYGVKFEGSSPDGVRTGNTYMHKNLPVQSNFKPCTIDSSDNIKYINPNDWTKYEDGTAVDATLNVMIEIPSFGILSVFTDNGFEVRISPYLLPGFTEVRKQYVSAYEGFSENGVYKSIKGVIPTVSKTRATFQTEARANGNEHWNIYTYEAHKAITWCFVVEYATLNSQKAVDKTLTAEGYHKGGLGIGCTSGLINSVYSFIPTGSSDSLGSGSGEVPVKFDTETRMCNRYRGIENPFGHVWKNVIDVIVKDNRVFKSYDFLKFGNDIALHKDTGIDIVTTNGYLSKLVNSASAELFGKEVKGNASTYFCDYLYQAVGTNTLLIGSGSDDGSTAGLFALDSVVGLGYAFSTVGSRLTYII